MIPTISNQNQFIKLSVGFTHEIAKCSYNWN
jgi:hypothetical protein